MKKENEIKYCLKEKKLINNNLGLFSLVDVNVDGQLDLAFPILKSQPPQVFVAYNQIKVENDWAVNYCETAQKKKFNKNEILFSELDTKINNFTQIFNLTNEENISFYESENSPIKIRFGDLNLDAYRDVLTVLRNTTDDTSFFRVIMNKPNKTEGSDPYKNSIFEHKFTHKYINYTDVDYVSFFDLDENGQLDIMMVRKTNEKNKYITTGFFNIEANDNFFLKSLTTKSKNNFFSGEIGTNYRYYVTDLNGERKLRVGVQHPQASCLNLDLPYSFEGIGLSYNYVENFHVSTSSPKTQTGEYMYLYTPIIPNSQLLIYNYYLDEDHDDWELDLIVTPTSKITLVVVVICIILFILLIIIITLHMMEKKDDENKNEGQLWL